MKPFADLTLRGQRRRLRRVAAAALDHYDIDVAALRFYATVTNTMFSVRDRAGRRLMLRIYADGETTQAENEAEMFWLRALVADTDLLVTTPVARRDGQLLTLLALPGMPAPQRVALFEWVPGRQLVHQLTPANYRKLGAAMARLHVHAATLNPLPAGINPKRWDTVFYYPDEPIVYNTPAYAHLFPPARVALLDAVVERANALLASLHLDPTGRRLIHNDLHFWNVHVYRGALYLLDFEDMILGYPVQDVAVTLFYGRDLPHYPALCAALREGYETVLPWPATDEHTVATLMAARTVNFINYVARIDDDPADYIDRRCAELV